ncbi:MAG: hypothetical protein PHZ17_03385 [Sulfurovum sp.]|nr:hypothetical protein [Sulfurovum sp.]
MKYLSIILFLSIFCFAGDGTPSYHIWNDLGITQEEYYYLSGFSGVLSGSIIAFLMIWLVIK